MIPYSHRFHGHNSLRYVYKNGDVARSRCATLKTTPNTRRKDARVSVVVSKKVLKSAVLRNRVRRRIYEYIREVLPRITTPHDVVVIVTHSEVLTMSHEDLHAQLDQLFAQAHLY